MIVHLVTEDHQLSADDLQVPLQDVDAPSAVQRPLKTSFSGIVKGREKMREQENQTENEYQERYIR